MCACFQTTDHLVITEVQPASQQANVHKPGWAQHPCDLILPTEAYWGGKGDKIKSLRIQHEAVLMNHYAKLHHHLTQDDVKNSCTHTHACVSPQIIGAVYTHTHTSPKLQPIEIE